MGTIYMASAGVRLTLNFVLPEGIKIGGWSESYDLIYTTLPQAIASMATINAFVSARCYCLGTGVVCTEAVLSANPGGIIVPPVARRATLQIPVLNPGSNDGAPFYNKALMTYPADYGTTVLYWSLQTDPNAPPVYRRNLWIAGIPDACDSTNEILPVAGPWNTAFGIFSTYMQPGPTTKTAGLQIVTIRSVDRSGANPFRPCTGYNFTNFQFTVPAHGFLAGQLIVAEGFRAAPGGRAPRGQYKVIYIDQNTIALSGAGISNATIPPGGFRAVVYVWNNVATATLLGFSKRNKGRPRNLLVGRRRVSKIGRA